ncbi:MAG TPA: hypothetical protein VNT56_02640, partial [Acidimicrobiales bacterium]|nr:hypothetical protein [Acidimicrobiales bacterium]
MGRAAGGTGNDVVTGPRTGHPAAPSGSPGAPVGPGAPVAPGGKPTAAAPPHRGGMAATGALAALAALVCTELVARALAGGASPVLAVGQEVIDGVPPAVEDFAIATFGTADKTVLLGAILAVVLGLGAALGVAGARRFAVAAWGYGAFALVGVAAVGARPGGAPLAAAVATTAGAAVGLALLHRAVSG